jgi:hypothetical protein
MMPSTDFPKDEVTLSLPGAIRQHIPEEGVRGFVVDSFLMVGNAAGPDAHRQICANLTITRGGVQTLSPPLNGPVTLFFSAAAAKQFANALLQAAERGRS